MTMTDMPTIDDYAWARRAEIERWLAAPPDWGTRVMSRPGQFAAKTAQRLVPVEVLRSSLRALDRAAGRFSGPRDILQWAGVDQIAEIAAFELPRCDELAQRVERRAMMLGGGSGAAFGIGGAAGMVADVPALLALALRTIHRSAYCYGEDWHAQGGLSIGVFALASANSFDEKQQAWEALRRDVPMLDAAWRDGVERVAERELAKDAAQFSLKTLSSRIGLHLGKRKAAGVTPVIGAVIGGVINAGYIRDIARVARYVLQDRWMRRHLPQLDDAVERSR
jgi:hypothetical protein